MTEKVLSRLSSVSGLKAAASDYAATGLSIDVTADAGNYRDAVKALRELEFLIESLTAVDAKPQMMVLGHFVRTDVFCRVAVRLLIDRENPSCPSIQDLYPGANWHERETHDFFGITFAGHPDLTPLILPEDAGDLHPLLKNEKNLKDLGDVVPAFKAAAPAPEAKPEVEK